MRVTSVCARTPYSTHQRARGSVKPGRGEDFDGRRRGPGGWHPARERGAPRKVARAASAWGTPPARDHAGQAPLADHRCSGRCGTPVAAAVAIERQAVLSTWFDAGASTA
jgi:hypothetical protein